MGLLGVDNPDHVLDRSAFRTSYFQSEGPGKVVIHEARVLNVNLTNWTVDCVTVFDQKSFFDIQVASPYMHSNRGEGFYAVPDIGAKCLVCIPSDGPPPFVLAFIMPPETIAYAGSDEAPAGTQSGQGNTTTPTDSTYAGGRPRAKLGDISIRGRDGNFCILHRGGVLQIGSTELSQRICIPLGNLMTDISQNYNHFNSGGSINWGIRQSSPATKQETEWKQTFRVYADDETADIRIAAGKVHQPVPEKPGDASSAADLAELGIGTSEPVVFEVVLAPGNGFDTDAGLPTDKTRDAVKLKVFFDRAGNAMMRAEGALSLRIKKKLRIRADDNIEVIGKKSLTLECEESMTVLGGKALQLNTKDGAVTINGGTKPVAHVGSQVNIVVTVPIPIVTSSGQGVISAGAVFSGVVSTGNPTIKV